MTYAHTNVNKSRTCRILTAIKKAYASVFTYESRMNVADPPSEMPKAAEQHTDLARAGAQNAILWEAMLRWVDQTNPGFRFDEKAGRLALAAKEMRV